MNSNENQTITINQNDEKKTTIQIRTYENMKDSLDMLRLMMQGEDNIEKLKAQDQKNMLNNLDKSLFKG